MSRRLNLRIQPDDYAKLQDLKRLLGLPTDSELVRVLIRWHHGANRTAVLKINRIATERMQAELAPKRRRAKK